MESIISIVGPGAVGQMLAFFLQRVAPVQLYGREGPVELQRKVQWRGQEELLLCSRQKGSSPLWIIATKAYDCEAALRSSLLLAPSSAVFVLLANGYLEPSLTNLRREHPSLILRKGLVTRGCRFLPDESLALSEGGEVIWGQEASQLPLERKIFTDLQTAGFAWSPQSCRRRREKWFLNTVLNTLCGAYALPSNGAALQHPELRLLAREVFRLGVRLWPNEAWQEEALYQMLHELIVFTRDNENSMARDRRLGRRTEAAFLSGYVQKIPEGQKDFPLLWRLHQQIENAAL